MAIDVNEILQKARESGEFKPYVEFSEDGDALTVRFKEEHGYSKPLTDHVTLNLSLDDDDVIVGCRIKGIKGIIEDLPNFIHVNHNNTVDLTFLFWSFRGAVEEGYVRKAMNELAGLAKQSDAKVLIPS